MNTPQSVVPIASRGLFNEFIYYLYRLASPVYHRENKEELFYKPHFSLLDITLDMYDICDSNINICDDTTGSNNNSSSTTRTVLPRYKPLYINYRVIDYNNETVLSRSIRSKDILIHSSASHPHPTPIIPDNQICTLFHGEIPLYKHLWLRGSVAGFLLVVLVLPVCTIMWFIGASIYYIFYGAELERRKFIENRNNMILENKKCK